jgi:hypothetical protein
MLTHSKEKRVASDIETLIIDESENGGSGQQLSPGHVELSSVEGVQMSAQRSVLSAERSAFGALMAQARVAPR